MSWFYNLKIKYKLFISFGVVLILTGTVGYTGYYGINKIIPQMTSMYNDRLVPALDLSEIVKAMYKMRIDVVDHYISQTQEEMHKYENSIEAEDKVIEERLEKYSKTYLTAEETEALQSFRNSWAEYKTIRTQIVGLSGENNKAAAKNLIFGEAKGKFKNAISDAEQLLNIQGVVAKELHDSSDQTASDATAVLIIVVLTALLLGIIQAILISSKLSKSIGELSRSAEEVAKGNLEVQIPKQHNDEVGFLSESLKSMVKGIKLGIEELNEEKASVERKVEEAVRESEEQKNYLNASVEEMLQKIKKFSEGDLTVELKAEREDDIKKLYDGFNKSVINIRSLIEKVNDAVAATASASSEISSSTEQMAAGAQEQSAQTSEIAAAVEEMTRTILETSKNTETASISATGTKAIAEKGKEKVKDTKESIEKIVTSAQKVAGVVQSLAKQSEQIGEITQVIDDIADQTNLLALNAAIEAARAGDQGRGFAVVADEVRKLAERTTRATKEIADTIKKVQSEAHTADEAMHEAKVLVEAGMANTRDVESFLFEITDSTVKVADLVGQISAASEEQSSAAEQISKNIEGISSVIHQSASGTQQVARTAEDLNRLTNNLQSLVNLFKVETKKSSFQVKQNGELIEY